MKKEPPSKLNDQAPNTLGAWIACEGPSRLVLRTNSVLSGVADGIGGRSQYSVT